jgi:hypothetical protein
MNNRWSDAARTAALAVRQARALAGRPVQEKAKSKKGLSALKSSPMVYAGGSATFDERTGKRIPEKNIWIPPPNDPHWNDPAFVESFKREIAKRKVTSSTPPGTQGIIRYDPKNPVDASKGGYGLPKKKATPVPKPRVIVGGKRYTRVGGKLYPDVR